MAQLTLLVDQFNKELLLNGTNIIIFGRISSIAISKVIKENFDIDILNEMSDKEILLNCKQLKIVKNGHIVGILLSHLDNSEFINNEFLDNFFNYNYIDNISDNNNTFSNRVKLLYDYIYDLVNTIKGAIEDMENNNTIINISKEF